jgi:hypothetical protein
MPTPRRSNLVADMDSELEYVWAPPEYDASRPPTQISTTILPHDPECPRNFFRSAKWSVAIPSRPLSSLMNVNANHRCPDGSCVLSQCENRTLRLFHLYVSSSSFQNPTSNFPPTQTRRTPPDRNLCHSSVIHTYPERPHCSPPEHTAPALQPQPLKIGPIFPASSAILDYAWYPRATVRDPASYCFVASTRECPVKLLDAADGRVSAIPQRCCQRTRDLGVHFVLTL